MPYEYYTEYPMGTVWASSDEEALSKTHAKLVYREDHSTSDGKPLVVLRDEVEKEGLQTERTEIKVVVYDLKGNDLLTVEGADLRGANLRRANLREVYLRGADLRMTDLWGADLQGADLRDANLRGANLRRAYLRDAYLWGADLRRTFGLNPFTILQANWGIVPDDLCSDLMNLDMANHPEGRKAFDCWIKTGECPYRKRRFTRVANFRENPQLYKPDRPLKSAYELMMALIESSCNSKVE